MNKIKLDDRLMSIVSFINKGDIVADIGSDHGLVPNFLVEEKISPKVYATDISSKSLEKTLALSQDRGNSEKTIPLVGDGLDPIVDCQLDTIILAGMGGELIISILDKHKEFIKSKNLIIQGQTSVVKIRKYLNNIGFSVIKEKIAKVNNIYYEIILAKYTGKIVNKNDYFGQNLIDSSDQLFIEYLIYNKDKALGTLKLIENLQGKEVEEKKNKLKKEIIRYEETLNECNS